MHGFAIAFELGPVFYVGGVRSFLSMKIKGSRGRSVRGPVRLTESDLRGFSNKSLRSSPWRCDLDRRVLAWFFSIDRGMLERSLCVRWSALKEVEDGFFRGQNFFDFFSAITILEDHRSVAWLAHCSSLGTKTAVR